MFLHHHHLLGLREGVRVIYRLWQVDLLQELDHHVAGMIFRIPGIVSVLFPLHRLHLLSLREGLRMIYRLWQVDLFQELDHHVPRVIFRIPEIVSVLIRILILILICKKLYQSQVTMALGLWLLLLLVPQLFLIILLHGGRLIRHRQIRMRIKKGKSVLVLLLGS